MGVAQDICKRLSELAVQRQSFERIWRQVRRVAAPETRDIDFGLGGSISGVVNDPIGARTSKGIYDTTAVNAVDRLASGIEALIIPQSEKWHGLGVVDLTRDDLDDSEKLWLERQANLLFKVRYDADSGWVPAAQTAIRRCIAFGAGFIWTEEGDGKALIRYRGLPTFECYIAENHYGVIDTFYRYYTLTARQAVQKFKDRCSAKLKTAANNPADMDRPFRFVHAVQPRADYGNWSRGVRGAEWASMHVEYETKTLVGESGFFEFPVVDFRWLPESGCPWGEGPVMKCLADIQSLNQMAKNEMLAGQQAVDPPLLVANAGVMNRPNTNPGAVNFGGLSMSGQKMIEPLFTGQRLDFATMVLEAKRNQVKDSMYLNLFALLVQNPQMSATEALIRANEKGELLGPAGSRLQQSLSRMIDREMGILIRKGLYDQGSAFQVPRSLQGRDTMAQMTSVLDRMRRTKEAEGALRLLEAAAPLAQIDPTVMDAMEPDETIRGLAEIFGVPRSFIRDKKVVAQLRQQRAEQQAAAQNIAAASEMAKASAQGSQALVNSRDAGLF